MEQKKELLYWSPAVRWRIEDNKLKVEKFNYGEKMASVFPNFYYVTQKGVTQEDIVAEFHTFDSKLLHNFISDLRKRRILVSEPLSVHELYFMQDRLYENPYKKEIKYNANALEEFKKEQLGRNVVEQPLKTLPLSECEYSDTISNRKTHRVFNETKKISFQEISRLLGVFRQRNNETGVKYYYPSAGGLYPIDLYLYVKEERVEGVDKGIYYYNPRKNDIELVNGESTMEEDAHFFTNQEIFHSSAVSIFFIYDANVTMPKYSGMGYFYAGIDTGIMVQTITQVAQEQNIGVCSIGDMNFEKIKDYFMLKKEQYHLHTLELGIQI